MRFKSRVQRYKNKLKQISIRGRYALGLIILDTLLVRHHIDDELMYEIFNNLKEFLSTSALDLWEDKIKEYDPDSILDNHPQNKFEEYDYLSVDKLQKLQKYYIGIPNEINDAISDLVEIGLGNLYGGTMDYSPYTLEPTLEMLSKYGSLVEVELAGILDKLIIMSPFSENNGWGYDTNMEEMGFVLKAFSTRR